VAEGVRGEVVCPLPAQCVRGPGEGPGRYMLGGVKNFSRLGAAPVVVEANLPAPQMMPGEAGASMVVPRPPTGILLAVANKNGGSVQEAAGRPTVEVQLPRLSAALPCRGARPPPPDVVPVPETNWHTQGSPWGLACLLQSRRNGRQVVRNEVLWTRTEAARHVGQVAHAEVVMVETGSRCVWWGGRIHAVCGGGGRQGRAAGGGVMPAHYRGWSTLNG